MKIKRLIILLICTFSIKLTAQNYIIFTSYFSGIGQYKECKVDKSKINWTKENRQITINLNNNEISLSARKFLITKKMDIVDGFVCRCIDGGGSKCLITYLNFQNGKSHMVTLEQSGVCFVYTDCLNCFTIK